MASGTTRRPARPAPRASVTEPAATRFGAAGSHVAGSRAGGPWAFVLLGLVLLFVIVVRWHALGVPLERDEGEFAYAGQLIRAGIPPYKLACNMKLPGTYMAYAALMTVFGETVRGVHLGLLAVNLAAIVLVFLLARRVADPLAAACGAALYGVLSLSMGVFGFAGHATQFVVPCAIAGLLFISGTGVAAGSGVGAGLGANGAVTRPTALLAGSVSLLTGGALLGGAILAKQPGAVFLLPAAVLIARPLDGSTPDARTLARRLALLACGVALPLLAVAAWLAATGVFARFWFWTVSYAAKYATETSLGDGLANFRKDLAYVTAGTVPLWLVAAAGLVALALRVRDRRLPFVVALLAAGLAGTAPGLYFRPHYFVVLLPALALTLAGGIAALTARTSPTAPAARIARPAALAVAALALVHAAWSVSTPYRTLSPRQVSQTAYGSTAFPDSEELATYIASHSAPDARLAILGSEPQIYFLANRRSASGHIYMYGLMEDQPYAATMQRELMSDVESAKPEFLLLVSDGNSWYSGDRHPDKTVQQWAKEYVPAHYDPVGLLDLPRVPAPTSLVRWDPAARPSAPNFVMVWRRKR